MSETKKTETAKAGTAATVEVTEPETVVYCGPTVRGVTRQYTPFIGGVPQSVKDFVAKYPIAAGLVVPLERFAQVRMNIEAGKGAESDLLAHVKKLMEEG